MSLKGFLKECNKRDVFKLLSIYIVSSWVVLQVLSVVAEPLGMPTKSVTYLILILLFGFPIYIYILWKSRIRYVKNEDEGRDIEANIKKEVRFKRMYFSALGLISIFSIVSVILIVNNTFYKLNIPNFNTSDKIAVLNFENNTGDSNLDIIGKMTADWLIHGITENHAGEVISSEVVSSYSNLLGTQMNPSENVNILNKFLKPNKIITGSYFRNGDTLILNCTIEDNAGNKIAYAFSPIECDVSNSLDCIENLRQEVVGYLFTSENEHLNLEEDPPKFEAYQKLFDANAAYEDPPTYIKLLEEAIALDSNYFEPKVLRVQHYYNEGNYKVSDSLNKLIATNTRLSKRQQYVLNFCTALIEGKNDKIYRNFKYEYDIAPKHLESNSTMMILLVQFINQPENVEAVFNEIPMEEMDMESDVHFIYRYYMMGYAYNELGDYDKTIKLLEPVISILEDKDLYATLITAYINSGATDKMENLMSTLELKVNPNDLINLNMHIGKRFLLKDNKSKADIYFDKVINSKNVLAVTLALAHYLKGDYETAKNHYDALYKNEPTAMTTITHLAICYFKLGDSTKAESLINSLESLRDDYQYGNIEYHFAQYYAVTDRKDKAMSKLLEAVAQGHLYKSSDYHHDIHFKAYKNLPIFMEILKFWQK